ncbi:MAG: YbgA family protein [Cellvibrionaceae bacterium]
MSETIASDQQKHGGIPVGLSSCLAGQNVRYNGGHTQSQLCLKTLKDYFDFSTFCPEVAAGFGTPRPTMRLVGDPSAPRLAFSDGDYDQDLSTQLEDGYRDQLSSFARLDGYILMKNSPSCGLERIKIYRENGYCHDEKGRGFFAAALQQHYPLMPLEEEGRLHDPILRENFILRVYAHHNFRHEVANQPSVHKLIEFHSSYKYVLMAHSQAAYKELGRYLAHKHDEPIEKVIDVYIHKLMSALAKPATRRAHANVMLHLLGYLKKSVAGEARQSIVDIIDRYRDGKIPLVTPLTMLRHYIDQTGSSYVQAQRYWQPYPEDLGLTNKL